MVADGLVYYISHSELATWKRCRRKWWLGWYRKLTPRMSDYTSVRASGTRVHNVLAAYYVPEEPPTQERVLAVHNSIIAADCAAIEAENVAVDAEDMVADSRLAEFNKLVTTERAMIEGYLEWVTETGNDAEFEVISSETPMMTKLHTYRIHGMPIEVYTIGIIDVRVRRILDNALAFVDHKTVQSLTQPLATLRMNEQMLHYMLLAQNGDHGTIGAYYNMLRRVKRTATAKPPFFDRVFIGHSQVEIATYRESLIGATGDILTAGLLLSNNTGDEIRTVYPTPKPDCSWDCEFFSVCPLFNDGSHAEAMLDARYVQRDPLDRYRNTRGTVTE